MTQSLQMAAVANHLKKMEAECEPQCDMFVIRRSWVPTILAALESQRDKKKQTPEQWIEETSKRLDHKTVGEMDEIESLDSNELWVRKQIGWIVVGRTQCPWLPKLLEQIQRWRNK